MIDETGDAAAAQAILKAAGVSGGGSPSVDDADDAPYPVVTSRAARHIEARPLRREPDPVPTAEPRATDDADDMDHATIESRRVSPTEPTSGDLDDANLLDDGLAETPSDQTGELASAASGDWAVGDRALVSAVLRGADVLTPAMDLLRRRSNRRDIDFLPAEAAANADDDTQLGVPVVWEGRPLGMLIAGDADRQTLASLTPHAAWLAGWLRLHRQSTGLRRAAFTDPLTGAWNRRYFERYLDASITRARQDRLSLTVLLFDVDDFKGYNDRYGHPAGDEILIETVRVLRSVIRPSDRVCRIGGDEFAVIFFEPGGPRNPSSRPPESVYVLTKRVQQKIREREFPKLGREAAGRLTFSGGLATYPWDGADAESLLARADELAIQSKRAGKNAITFGPGAERINGPEPRR